MRKEVGGVDKIQFYIPSLLDHLDHHALVWLEDVRIVGVKTNNVKYFIDNPAQEKKARMEQIVAEDFTIYDLQLNFQTKTLSFYLECKEIPSKSIMLPKVFQTFAVQYSKKRIGFFLYATGRNRPKTTKVLPK